MSTALLYSLGALAALVPAAIFTTRRREGPARAARPEPLYWWLLGVAFVGSAGYGVAQATAGWNATFAQALWLSIAVTLALFLGFALLTREAWRLARLLLPYLLALALLAVIWGSGDAEGTTIVAGWLLVHIVLSIVTYGLITLAAIAAVAVSLQERALKARNPGAFAKSLPSIADAEGFEFKLLYGAEAVLLAGIITGIAHGLVEGSAAFVIDHKTLFAVLAFVLIGLLLVLRRKNGLRGRAVARFALIAYLFLTLAYPGVKFVTDVILS